MYETTLRCLIGVPLACALVSTLACADLEDDVDVDASGTIELDDDDEFTLVSQSTPVVSTTRIRGRATFHPDFKYRDGSTVVEVDNTFPAPGRIPLQGTTSNLSYLFVCAYEQDGGNDFATGNYGGDDDLLGCARADIHGRYLIDIERENAGVDVYLVTTFCDGPVTDIQIPGGSLIPKSAEVCFSTNTVRPANPVGLSSPGGEPERKYTWTRTYWGGLTIGADTKLSWNLSCPNKAGDLANDPELYPYVSCTTGEREPTENTYFASQTVGAGDPVDCTPPYVPVSYTPPQTGESYIGDTNSNIGFNKEAVHMFRTGAEIVRRFGTIKPNSGNIAPGADLCTRSECQNEVRLVVREAITKDFTSAPQCSLDLCGGTNKSSGDIVCARHRSGSGAGSPTLAGSGTTHNPWVIAHEIGHIEQARWEDYLGSLGQGGTPGNGSQRGAFTEGYANFVAMATWFEPTDPDVNFTQLQGESVSTANTFNWVEDLCGIGNGCNCNQGDIVGEGWESHFFWDLYDPIDLNGVDQVEQTFAEIRMVWGLFGDGTNDRQEDECGAMDDSDGVNAYDYKFHYDSIRVQMGWESILSAMSLNCMTKHWAGAQCN
ncbi:MAG: hypothetical protein HC927_04415 [Deltaproteobacteria bacterium]|nr:hypothetical protein [Deltaproteobacteria bacterium]